MEQDTGESGGGSEEMNKQNHQDRRLMKPMQGEDQQQQLEQQQQPQECPRCDSLNTKFCYYNNYSLSQPRYFCKTCRRYWTLGGTLRNVPVGGGCRKGKRSKPSSSSSSSGENSRSQSHTQHQNLATTPQNIISSNTNSGNKTASLALTTKESGDLVVSPPSGISSMGSYYPPGGGFLNSLAAIQSLNNQPPQSFTHHHQQPINQHVNLGGDLGASSNLGLLRGFNAAVPSFGSQQHHHQQIPHHQRQFYQMGNRDADKAMEHPFYPHEDSLIQSGNSRPASSSHHQQQNWHQSFISNTNPTLSDTALWSISTSTTPAGNTTNSNNTAAGASSLNPDRQWHGLPGYGPPP